MSDAPSSSQPGDLPASLRAARADLLACVAELSETRVYRATDREGWTVKHELAYLAAADRVLLTVVEELRSSRASDAVVVANEPKALRRLVGQQMHVTQELRLAPLRDELATLGDQLAAALERHASLLDRPVALGGTPAPARDHAHAHLKRAREGAARVREAMQ